MVNNIDILEIVYKIIGYCTVIIVFFSSLVIIDKIREEKREKMPVYTYQCENCSHVFEESYKIDDRKIPEGEVCPECKESSCVKQTLSGGNFTLDPMVTGRFKMDEKFTERMKAIKKAHPGNTINLWKE